MAVTNSLRLALVLLIGTPLGAYADTQFRVRPMKPTQAPLDKGLCDIRLRVEGEVELTLRGGTVSLHTLSGRDARDNGSACNQPLPDRDIRGFALEAKQNRDAIRLVAAPSSANDFQAVIRIRNVTPGDDRYHFSLTWKVTAAGLGDEPQAGPAGFVWNNATRYKSRGQGEAAAGDVHLGLLDVDVSIDLGGRVWVVFHTARKEPLSFSGVVNNSEEGRLRADVVCDGPDWHVQGPMFLSVDEARDRVTAITLDATDGHDHLHLDWKRR